MNRKQLIWLAIAVVVVVVAVVFVWRRTDEGPSKMLVVLPTTGNPFWVDVRSGAEEAASLFEDEFETIIRAGDEDAASERQKEILNAFKLDRRVAAVVIGPASSSAIIPEVRDYRGRGVPVVIIDSRLDDPTLASTFIGSNNEVGGRLAAQEMVRQVGTSEDTILLIGGSIEHQTARDRARGFKAAAPSNWRIREETGDWNRSRAREIMEAVAVEGMPAGVFAASDEMAMGAIEGLKGLEIDEEVWPVIVGFDATEEGLRAIDDGFMWATVKQRAFEMGREGVTVAAGHARGEVGLPTERLLDVELIRR